MMRSREGVFAMGLGSCKPGVVVWTVAANLEFLTSRVVSLCRLDKQHRLIFREMRQHESPPAMIHSTRLHTPASHSLNPPPRDARLERLSLFATSLDRNLTTIQGHGYS